ncbi:MAG: tyrosine-protein phosphatase [Anaerolineae bacterium]|nr:tyrosine-protein phosphatase [Anaerolineae bacterium]
MSEKTATGATKQAPNRHLDWQQCRNTRDLGGLPAHDGKETRWKAIVRSDTLSRLTDEGKQALLDYGVRTIIDLRNPQEAAQEPLTIVRSHQNHLDYFNLPLEKYHPHASALINQAKTRGEVYSIMLDHYPDEVAEVMRAMIKAQPGGIVFHCHAGKDRTGIVAALLLSLVDVPAETIAADYAASQERLEPYYERILTETGGDKEKSDFWTMPAEPGEMTNMLEHIETHYGGAEKYLLGAGLQHAEVDQLKERLLSS